jgi:four helix bundle protein
MSLIGEYLMSGFRDLNVWKKGKALAVDIYKMTAKEPFKADFGFKDQIRRAAVSISCNIAEGDERGTNKDAVRFFFISKGSLAELETQLEIAYEIGYLKKEQLTFLIDACRVIGKMLGSLIKARSKEYR